ncbi:glycerol dehydratase large subunit [Mycobacteroides abscessus subsp. abscessus]|nr:glycerol dehydratase large subunit [Mycobacteroides abscessus subsp. abscessus]
MRSKRFEVLDERPVNKDGFVNEWPEVGLIAMESPNDPKPSISIRNGETGWTRRHSPRCSSTSTFRVPASLNCPRQ